MIQFKGVLNGPIDLYLDDNVESDRCILEKGDILQLKGDLLNIKGQGSFEVQDIRNTRIVDIFNKCTLDFNAIPTLSSKAYFVGCLLEDVTLENFGTFTKGTSVVVSNGILLLDTKEIPMIYFPLFYLKSLNMVERDL